MNLVQYTNDDGNRGVGRVLGPDTVEVVDAPEGMYGLAQGAIEAQTTLETVVENDATGVNLDYGMLVDEGRLLPPINHEDPAHLLVTGTGLTHLGSADARDEMHKKVSSSESELSDSMRMFQMGLEGGKPADGSPGVQPEWFYKGDGSVLVAPGHPFQMPSFALDGGEEPEIVGVYLIGPDGSPYRLGFALGNEFSDHVMEKQNYLYLAHSKLRECSIGPELRTGPLSNDVSGQVRVRRGGEVLWEDTWLSGEANMSHYIGGLEHHHFKYDLFRRPGDVHLHYFGTAVLSYTAGVVCAPGDTFEVESPEFGRPLSNELAAASSQPAPAIRPL